MLPFFCIRRSYRKENKLPYPVNAARNIARSTAKTRFVLTSDVELLPSPRLAVNFAALASNEEFAHEFLENAKKPSVFAVPTFEIARESKFPRNKKSLVALYSAGKAVYFHKHACPHCQRFPGLEKWLREVDKSQGEREEDASVGVFQVAKRHPPFHRWEPIFIGARDDPLYDERLSWEGFQDKMSQMHELCLAGYRFVILDTAFLVHRGIKRKVSGTPMKADEGWRKAFYQRNQEVYKSIMQNLAGKYPKKSKCKTKFRY